MPPCKSSAASQAPRLRTPCSACRCSSSRMKVTNRRRAMAGRSRRRVRAGRHHPRRHPLQSSRRALAGRSLHHRGILVHGIDVVCQSGRRRCALPDQYILRHPADRSAGLHRKRASWCGDRLHVDELALARRESGFAVIRCSKFNAADTSIAGRRSISPAEAWRASQAGSTKSQASATCSSPMRDCSHRTHRRPSGSGSPACLRSGSYIRSADRHREHAT